MAFLNGVSCQLTLQRCSLKAREEPATLWFSNEVLLSRLFRHPNLLTSRLVFSSSCQLWVLTPLMSYGSADTLLRTYFPDGMSESLIAYLLVGVLKALEYLHRMGYVHRSEQIFHILLSGEGHVYLSGLHSAYSMMREGKRQRAVFDMPHHSPSLLPWLSPELLRQDLHGYGVKSDIYSLGIVACELVSGRVPFQDMPPTQVFQERPHLLETPLELSSPAKPPTTAPQLSKAPSPHSRGVSESFLKRQRPISRRSVQPF
uniref:STE20 related adaptor beta n=1 Tax=Neogobius melanostomus TaxID=47308 RepID=A0A8C6WE98_9GOBI